MERDFIQNAFDEYELRKENIKKENEKELEQDINAKFSKILEKYNSRIGISEEDSKKYWEDKLNKIYQKSIQDEENKKRKEMTGKTCKSEEMTGTMIKTCIIIVAIGLIGISIGKYSWNSELVHAYKHIRAVKTENWRDEEKEQLREITYKDVPMIKDAIKNYDGEYQYTVVGDRTDGTHNDFYVFDGDSLVQLRDKQLDPIENILVDGEIKSIKGEEKKEPVVLYPKGRLEGIDVNIDNDTIEKGISR